MKKAKLLSILFLFQIFTFKVIAQTFTIPDPKFAAFLNANYPAIITGNDLDIAGAGLITGTLVMNGLGISDLSGIEHFTSVGGLQCNNNNLTTIPGLDKLDLTLFEARSNQLIHLDGIENSTGLIILQFDFNQVSQLPDISLFPDLTNLIISNNPIIATVLNVSNNPLLINLFIENLGLSEVIGLNLLTNLRSL